MTQTSSVEQKYAWVYLINLGFYFIPLFINDYPIWQLIVSMAVLIPFVACYFRAYSSTDSQAFYPILAMILLATVITPINPGSLSLFTFAGFFIGFFYPFRTALLSFIGLVILLSLLTYWSGFSRYFVIYGAVLIAAVGLFGIVERKRLTAKRLVKQSNDEIAQLAKIVERERIARDLHDIMGHSLSSISLKADLAEKLLTKEQTELARKQVVELAHIARESLAQIRQTVSDYKHTGLDATVTQLCQRLRDKGLSPRLNGDIPKLPARVESQLILILTELVSNILHHSQAQGCELNFTRDNEDLTIELIDEARPKAIIEGNGLKGIRERIASLEGDFDYSLNNHYIITLRIPLNPPLQEIR